MPETLFLQLCRFGDCVQSTVLIASWRACHPNDRIVVLTRPAFAPAFHGNPDIDELMLYNPPANIPRLSAFSPDASRDPVHLWLKPVRERGFRTVVNLTHDLFSCRLAEELHPEVLRGFAIDAEDKMVAKDPWSIYLLSFLNFRHLNLFNLVDIYAHLSGAAAVRDAPRFVVDGTSREEADRWLAELQPAECLIGFQPGASNVERRWPADNFVQLGRDLVERHGARILVFGSADEKALAEDIADRIPLARSLAGRTTLPQLAALLGRCQVLVSNDTGTLHLAAALGVRIVGMYESSAFFRETGPYGAGHWVIQSGQVLQYGERSKEELQKMQRVPVDHVKGAVEALLSDLHGTHAPILPADGSADHYRSIWSNGHIDFLPAVPVVMQPEDLCMRLQRPIWLAMLDGRGVDVVHTIEDAQAILQKYYLAPTAFDQAQLLVQFTKEVRNAESVLHQLQRLVDHTLQKLRKNPAYRVPDDQLSMLTDNENEVLQTGSSLAVQAFVAYFEIALAMVRGENTLEFLENYRRHVIFLAKQLKAFGAVLKLASSGQRASRG